jgi:hypothetical protein
MILMPELSITRAIGKGGPEIENFLGPEMATREASAIWGPKKSRFHDFHEFQGPPLLMALVMDSARIKTITSRKRVKFC